MPKKKQPTGTVKYTTDKAYLSGIPARDMTMAEWMKIPKELRELGLEIGLYTIQREEGEK